VPASANLDMADVKRVINEVRKLEPELSKEFRAKAQTVAQPVRRTPRCRCLAWNETGNHLPKVEAADRS
jgi:hypothetical protein